MSATQNPIPAQYPILQIPASIDYTSKDFKSFVQSMLKYAGQVFPEWNTTSEGDFGVMMVELMAYMGDILSFYGDRITQEAYLPTATQRLSLLNIAATLGYIPAASTPASGTVTFQTIATGPAVTIPKLTKVTTNVIPAGQNAAPVYETQNDLVVAGNGGTGTVPVLEGTTMTMIQVGTSTGVPGQAMALPQLGVVDGSVSVWVQSTDPTTPTQWLPIDFLIDAQPDDAVFSISVDQNGATSIVFGDSRNGMIPGIGLNIWASYRVGVGAAGNLPSGSVNALVQTVPGVDIALLGDGITPNTSAMGGGSDPESNEAIRKNASLAYRTQYRAVSPQDYTDLAYNVPGVLMANAVFGNANSVTLYVLGPNYAEPGWQLVDNILDYFDGKSAGGVTLSVADPAIIPVDIGSSGTPVQLQVKPKYSQAVVKTNVTAALTALLSPPNVSFGQLLTISDIFNAVMGVDGVAYALIPLMTREDIVQTDTSSIQFGQNEVPMVGQQSSVGPPAIYITASGGIGTS